MTTYDSAATQAGDGHAPDALRLMKAVRRSRPHVLIVDDHPACRAICTAFCDLFDFSCETVSDGAEAIDAVTHQRFDVILMDIHMPGIGGIEAARAIRAIDGPAGRTPIIAVSTADDPNDQAHYLAQGLYAVVGKPITASRLFAAMNDALSANPPEPRSWAPRKLAP
jgi:CheY-like chemotaxis protein